MELTGVAGSDDVARSTVGWRVEDAHRALPDPQGTGFESIDDVEAVLARLAEGVDPFAANIGRAAGQSQDRWAHLLGDVVPDVTDAALGRAAHPADADASLAQRVADLEARLSVLEAALVSWPSSSRDRWSIPPMS